MDIDHETLYRVQSAGSAIAALLVGVTFATSVRPFRGKWVLLGLLVFLAAMFGYRAYRYP